MTDSLSFTPEFDVRHSELFIKLWFISDYCMYFLQQNKSVTCAYSKFLFQSWKVFGLFLCRLNKISWRAGVIWKWRKCLRYLFIKKVRHHFSTTVPCRSIYSSEGRFSYDLETNTQFRTSDPDVAHVHFLPLASQKWFTTSMSPSLSIRIPSNRLSWTTSVSSPTNIPTGIEALEPIIFCCLAMTG